MTDQNTSAEGAYRQALMLQPDTADWRRGLARCLFKERKFEEAAALCGELIRRDAARVDYWVLQANAYVAMKQPLKAAEDYETLDAAGLASAAMLHTLGDIYVNEGLPDLAADVYLRALDRDPAAPPNRTLQHIEAFVARSAYPAAERLIARLRALPEDRFDKDQRKRFLKVEARMAAARGPGNPESVRILDEIVALDPLDGEALILLAQQHAATGNVEQAVFLFERAQGIAAYEAEASLRHAQCLVRNGRYQQALPLLKRSQELRPRDDVARYVEQVERVARMRQ